jgi:cytochrome c oxidase subunit 2
MYIDRLERYWIMAVAGTLGAFVAALLVATLVFGVRLPSPAGRVDPRNLAATEFASPGLRDMGGGKFNLTMVAQMWNFDIGQGTGQPAEIRVPAGAEVTMSVTSKDITHGFFIEEHDANLMLLPGQIARTTVTFDRPGTYHIICHEYCGPGHQTMFATIIVE